MAGRLRKLVHNHRRKELFVVDWTALGDVVILGEMLRATHLKKNRYLTVTLFISLFSTWLFAAWAKNKIAQDSTRAPMALEGLAFDVETDK